MEISNYHKAQSGLIFNSGYVANLGLFATIPQRGDTIIYDELIHASIRDGIRLSNADSFSFQHNNLKHLNQRLSKAKGNVFVAVESIYSMDGDSPSLIEVLRACKTYNANLIVDEAHAVGVVGERGEGLVAKLNLQKEVFATVVTFGKALNFCRSFIYTTAPSPETVGTIRKQYHKLEDLFRSKPIEQEVSFELKKYFIDNV